MIILFTPLNLKKKKAEETYASIAHVYACVCVFVTYEF